MLQLLEPWPFTPVDAARCGKNYRNSTLFHACLPENCQPQWTVLLVLFPIPLEMYVVLLNMHSSVLRVADSYTLLNPRYYSCLDWTQGRDMLTSMWCIFWFLAIKIVSEELLQSVMDEQFASLDLADWVIRDKLKLTGLGTYGNVYKGTLHPGQTKVVVKVVRGSVKTTLPMLKVNSLFALISVMSHDNVSGGTQRSSCLVQAWSQKYYQTTWGDNCFWSYDIYSVSIDVQGECIWLCAKLGRRSSSISTMLHVSCICWPSNSIV